MVSLCLSRERSFSPRLLLRSSYHVNMTHVMCLKHDMGRQNEGCMLCQNCLQNFIIEICTKEKCRTQEKRSVVDESEREIDKEWEKRRITRKKKMVFKVEVVKKERRATKSGGVMRRVSWLAGLWVRGCSVSTLRGHSVNSDRQRKVNRRSVIGSG